jgi:hypothetical protein
MKRILIIETEFEGHYLTGYIKYILRSFKKNEVSITLLTSEEAKKKAQGAFEILKKENVKFNVTSIPIKKNTNHRSVALLFAQIKLYFLIKRKFKLINAKNKYDHIFVTSIQQFDKALVFLGTPFCKVNFSGIFLGAKFHLKNFGIRHKSRFNFLSKIFFQQLLSIHTLQCIITNDHLLYEFYNLQKYKNFNKLKFLHDPKEFNFKYEKFSSRKKLGLPQKSLIILVYGALIESKGIIELLSIFKVQELNVDIRVVLAGKQLETIKNLLEKDNFVKKLKLNRKLFLFNHWLSEKDEARIFSATDIVWIGYKNYTSPSGVLYQAVNKSLPVLISNDGLIHHLNKKINVGISIDISNPRKIIDGINFIIKKKNMDKLKRNIKNFSKIADAKKWVINFKKIYSSLY